MRIKIGPVTISKRSVRFKKGIISISLRINHALLIFFMLVAFLIFENIKHFI